MHNGFSPSRRAWNRVMTVLVWTAALLVMALVAGIIGWGEEITPMLAERLETEIKYAGYIARQDRMIREVARHEKTLIPEDFEYAALTGLTLEAREKLARIRPRNLGQARRIPGVSPSDVAQLSIALAGKQQK
jgi:tRNA uridine 5-carboxymethylaminomethyl modification enzyme